MADGLLLDNHVGGCTLHMNKDRWKRFFQALFAIIKMKIKEK